MSTSSELARLAPWVCLARPMPAPRVRLLCFHHAGGGASFFKEWPARLAAQGIEVWPVQLPGRESRSSEPAATSLEQVVTDLTEHLTGPLGTVPYAVYGHSAGALVAGAFSQRMTDAGLPPRRAFLAAARPVSHPDPDFPLHQLDDAALQRRLEGYGGIPAALHAYPELIEMARATARADLALVESAPWPATPWLTAPLTVFGGERDAAVPTDVLPHWSAVSTGPSTVETWRSGHFPDASDTARLVAAIRHALV